MYCVCVRRIDSAKFISLAAEICKIFPNEDSGTYYVPYQKFSFGKKVYAHGKLLDHYNFFKKKLRVAGLLKKSRVRDPDLNDNAYDLPMEIEQNDDGILHIFPKICKVMEGRYYIG